MLTSSLLPELLSAVGDALRERGVTVEILVVGGTAMLLRRESSRLVTMDVDVLARIEGGGSFVPTPFSADLQHAVRVVADGYGLDSDWMNAAVALNWAERWPRGLPPDLLGDAEKQVFGGLTVYLAGRSVMVPLKLHAVVDQARALSFDASGQVVEVDLSPPDARRRLSDLITFAPSDAELAIAAGWVRTQDVSPDLDIFLTAATSYVRSHRR